MVTVLFTSINVASRSFTIYYLIIDVKKNGGVKKSYQYTY